MSKAETLAKDRAQLEDTLLDLRALKPNAAEWALLSAEQSRLSHAKELLQTAEATRAGLIDDGGLLETLGAATTSLAHAERIDPALSEAKQLLDSAQVQLHEAAQALRQYCQKLDLDPERLQEAEARLSSLFALGRKLRVKPEALEEAWQSAEARLGELTASQDIPALEAELEDCKIALIEAAKKLSAKRTKAAQKLSAAVTKELPLMAMENAGFEIQLHGLPQIESTGAEAVEFAFRSHASLPFAPLAKVASGGELARLSLAILVVCGDKNGAPTLIFDEVDVGIGGRVAAQVGRKLQTLATDRQVFCVTHMPQVAAHADHHFIVSRDNSQSPTTTVTQLDDKARQVEMARMLAGHEVGSATEKMAKELLTTSKRRV